MADIGEGGLSDQGRDQHTGDPGQQPAAARHRANGRGDRDCDCDCDCEVGRPHVRVVGESGVAPAAVDPRPQTAVHHQARQDVTREHADRAQDDLAEAKPRQQGQQPQRARGVLEDKALVTSVDQRPSARFRTFVEQASTTLDRAPGVSSPSSTPVVQATAVT